MLRWDRGVDSARFRPGAARQTPLPDAINVLYSGRITREKGADLLADAFLKARARDPRLHLVLAGGGPEQELLRERVGDAATFLGWLEGDELARAYASADMFLFPSRTDTFGQVILEAQASGLPVVAVAAGGPLSLIEDGVSGLLRAPDAQRAGARPCSSSRTRRCCASAWPERRPCRRSRERTWERALERLSAGYRRALRTTIAQLRRRRRARLQPTPRIAVALHDIEPATFERCALIRDWLDDHGVDRVTLLVIPARDLHPLGERSPEMTSWLASAAARATRSPSTAFSTSSCAADGSPRPACALARRPARGEFVGLDGEETRRAVDAGWRVLKLAGVEPDGFVAPAYAYTAALREALTRASSAGGRACCACTARARIEPARRRSRRRLLAPAWGMRTRAAPSAASSRRR